MNKITGFIFILLTTLNQGCDSSSIADITGINLNTYNEKRPVKVVFEALVNKINEQSDKNTCLKKPATDKDILKAEIIIGEPFPEDVKAVYKLANGQRDGNNCVPLFLEGYNFMSLDEVITQWTLMDQLASDDKDFSAMYDKQGAVNGYHWTPKWIPLGYFMNGDFISIDYIPTELGVRGQIIEFIHDDIPRTHLAINFRSYLGNILNGMTSGDIIYHQKWGVLTNKK